MAADTTKSPVHWVERAVMHATDEAPIEIPAGYTIDDVVDALVALGFLTVADA